MFADYRIPQVLLAFGVFTYSNDLLDFLNKDGEMKNGDPREIEIRGASILAVEKLKEKIREKLRANDLNPDLINSIMIDHWLWDYRRMNIEQTDLFPYHKYLEKSLEETSALEMANERPRSSMSRNEYQMIIRSKEAYDRTDDPIQKLRFSCQARGFSGYLSMGSMFRRMDTDGSGKLDFEEFALGMLNTGIDLDNKGLKSLFEAFDKEDTGEISITEFRMTIRPVMPMNRKRLVMEAWKKLDARGIGIVSHDEIRKAYNVLNYASYLSGDETEEEIFERFIKNFEEGLFEGKVTIEEFKDFYAGVSASVESDTYFDLMMRYFWRI